MSRDRMRRVDESLRSDVPQLVMYRAAKMDRLLAERHARSAVDKVPSEYWQPDSGKSMHLSVCIDDEFQWDIIGCATIRELRLRANRGVRRRQDRIGK